MIQSENIVQCKAGFDCWYTVVVVSTATAYDSWTMIVNTFYRTVNEGHVTAGPIRPVQYMYKPCRRDTALSESVLFGSNPMRETNAQTNVNYCLQ